MPTLLILIGPPGSGKTYFAEKFSRNNNYIHINSDVIRAKYFPDPSFTSEEREKVYEKIQIVISEILKDSKNVVFDGNLLTNEARKQAYEFYKHSVGAKVLFVMLDIPREVAIERALERKTSDDGLYNAMPEERAIRMHDTFESLDPELPSLIIDATNGFGQAEAELKLQLSRI